MPVTAAHHSSTMRPRAYSLRLAPLAVALILLTTAVPLEWRGAAAWSTKLGPKDLLQNILLYAPLGVALWRAPLLRVAAIAGLLSLGIEAMQLFQAGRFASPVDLITNVAGAVAAARLFRFAGRLHAPGAVRLRASLPLHLLAGIATVSVLLAWGLPTTPSDLSNWESTHRFRLGDTDPSDRVWEGRLLDLALIAAPWRGAETPPPIYASGGAVTLGEGRSIALPADISTSFVEEAQRRRGFTVRARIVTARADQIGPAVIVGLAPDQRHRNLELGQEQNRIILRVRTPVNGVHADEWIVRSEPVVPVGRPIDVLATYDGTVARVYLDGHLSGRTSIGSGGCIVHGLCDWAVAPAWALVGGTWAMLLAMLLSMESAGRRCMVAVAAGTLAVAPVLLMLPRALLVGPDGWLPLLAWVGAGSVALAFTPDYPRAASAS